MAMSIFQVKTCTNLYFTTIFNKILMRYPEMLDIPFWTHFLKYDTFFPNLKPARFGPPLKLG